ncbi:hypothetical protein KR026_009596, partial [Drosophila bipectinata]
SSRQRLRLMWKTFSCEANSNYISGHNCFIVEPEKSLITAELNYFVDISQYNATFKLFMPRQPSRQYQKVIDVNVDVCQFSKGLHGHRFMTIVIKGFGKKAAQLKCPHPKVTYIPPLFYYILLILFFKGNYSYPNINIADNLPAFLPETDFKIEMNFLTLEAHVFNTSLTGFLYDPLKKKFKPK